MKMRLIVTVVSASFLLVALALVRAPGAGQAGRPSGADDTSELSLCLVGQWGGGVTRAVAVQGGYAYAGEGARLSIVDVSDPAAPVVIGKTSLLPGVVQGGAVAGDYAYIAAGEAGLLMVDVSDPAHPVEVGFCDTPDRTHAVAVAGRYAYLAERFNAGVRVVDVSDPVTPMEVAFYDTPGDPLTLAVAGQYAYVADGDAGLLILRFLFPNPVYLPLILRAR